MTARVAPPARRPTTSAITGFGQTGPYAPRAGYDFLIQGMGGLMSLTGRPDTDAGAGPLKVGVALTDVMTGPYATVAVLAALSHRERTGEGQHIDMALLDVQVACLANEASNYLVCGTVPRFEAQDAAPQAAVEAFRQIGAHYEIEEDIKRAKPKGEAKRLHRLTHSKPLVEKFFEWIDRQFEDRELLPSNPLTKALAYARTRCAGLEVFLSDPDVPMDTNHVERALRVSPLGR